MRKRRALRVLCCFFTLLACASPCQTVLSTSGATLGAAAAEKILVRARRAYYSLQAKGMSEFRCDVVPDFDTMYNGVAVDSVGREQLLPILKKVKFQVVVGPTGASSVSHESAVAPPSADVAERLRGSIGGMEQALTGFLQSWAPFVVLSIFPESSSNYQLQESAGEYRLLQNDSSGQSLIVMNRNLVIEHTEITSPKVNGIVDPTFTTTTDGLLLTAYAYDDKVSADQRPTQQASVKIEYQEVNGFQLPREINASMHLPNGVELVMPIAFSNCQAKGK